MKAIKHFQTITKHKILVMQECFRVGLYRQGLLHDLSKYGWTEFRVGCRYYQGTRSPKMQNGKTKGILLHGFITKEEISIIMNTGLIMILTEKSLEHLPKTAEIILI